ncbi:MAG: PQQ-dependent sugar dehydrogenase, partial [Desulfohalobiaceae bacterium]
MQNPKQAVMLGVLALLLLTSSASVSEQIQTIRSKKGTAVGLERLVEGLNHPWGMAFLPGGRLLITERNTGRLYILNTDNTLSKPVQGVPEVWAHGQGGLMDVALHPEYEENNYIYLSYAKPGPDGKAATALGRGKLSGERIKEFQDVFVQEPFVNGTNHFGNRIAFSPDGRYLFLGLGERFQFDPAQDLSNHLGKVIRIYPDGGVPEDNPFVGRENAKSEIWSYGHRNIE